MNASKTDLAGQELRESQRRFGMSAGLLCGLFTFRFIRHGQCVPAGVFGLLGMALIALGLAAPTRLRGPSAVWWRGLRALGWVNTRLLLSLAFFLIITPTGVVLRLLGWDPLRTNVRRRGESNWMPYAERHRDAKHYERMY